MMKYFNPTSILLFTTLFLISCSKNNAPKERFKHVYSIQAHKLNVDTYKLSSFGKMIPFEQDSCIIKENFNRESLIDKIYYTKDSVLSLAKIGSGPNEYSKLELLQKESNQIILLESQRNQIIIKDLTGETIRRLNLNCNPFKIIQAKDQYIASGVLDKANKENKRYAILNNKGEYIKPFGDFPNDNNDSDAESKVFAYQGAIVYNSNLNRFATGSFNGAIFELYQIDATPYLIKNYHDIYPIYIKTNSSIQGYKGVTYGREDIFGYVDMYATNQYIYALYSGKNLETVNNQGAMDAMLSTDILIYDWNGECVCRLISDIPLFNICTTDDDKQMMALGWEEDFHLYSFDLSHISDLAKR